MKRRWSLFAAAVLMGIWMSFQEVNPYSGKIDLYLLVMQLCGARGNLALGINVYEIMRFALCFVPSLVFQMLMGTELYKYYCTASVYVFSRIEDRAGWAGSQLRKALYISLAYQTVFVATVTAVAALRYRVEFGPGGVYAVFCYLAVYSLWNAAFALLVKLASVKFTSSIGFTAVAGIQLFFAAVLILLKPLDEDPRAMALAAHFDPVSYLVLSWGLPRFVDLPYRLSSALPGFYIEDSILFAAAVFGIIAVLYLQAVKKQDIIVSDRETGGV